MKLDVEGNAYGMEPWKAYALGAALFAGMTSVLAKAGLQQMPADVGLAARTTVIFVLVIVNMALWHGFGTSVESIAHAGKRPLLFLAASGLATTLSWVCYYRAMATGTVTFVALVDKSSIVVTIVLSALFLGEAITLRTSAGAALIVAGLLVLMK